MSRKNLIIIILILLIAITAGILFLLSCKELPTQPASKDELTEPTELIVLNLSDYPKVFSKDVIIVIGENATEMERETSQMIIEILEGLIAPKPQLKQDTIITDSDLSEYNLILVGTPESNNLLNTLYNMTGAESIERATREYPGENKGLLQILNSPWNKEKALLIVAGSDEMGIKADSEVLKNTEEVGKLKEKTLIISSRDENEEWLGGGTKTSSIQTKLSRRTLSPNEAFIITVKSWTFTGGKEKVIDYNTYFRLYSTNNPQKPLRTKKVREYSDKSYVRAGPFDWIITAPSEKGTYLYRVVKKTNSEPSFDDYDMMQKVEFEINVK